MKHGWLGRTVLMCVRENDSRRVCVLPQEDLCGMLTGGLHGNPRMLPASPSPASGLLYGGMY